MRAPPNAATRRNNGSGCFSRIVTSSGSVAVMLSTLA
jgi:hypothetical protein